MAVEGDQDPPDQDKLQQFFSLYKFPLIFASVGLIFIIGAAILIIRQNTQSANVIFITQSTESARIKIKVDLAGSIMNPGVYELPEGSRISDALALAGGFSALADRDWVEKNINRAAKVIDGGKIYIPKTGEFFQSSNLSPLGNLSDLSGSSSIQKININTASQSELESLPGVGPATAGKIISGRPYQTIEELKTKKITGNALFEKIKDQITL